MNKQKPVFINPYTDFGFKRLFGKDANIVLLKNFLQNLSDLDYSIPTLSIKNNEQKGDTPAERSAVFDIFCEDMAQNLYILEMQKAPIENFIDRSVYYTNFPIRHQAVKGRNWRYYLKRVNFIGILDFVYDSALELRFREIIQLRNERGQILYDKLKIVFLQMPLFTKTEDEIETQADYWLFFLKNIHKMENLTQKLSKNKVIKQAAEALRYQRLNPIEQMQYEMEAMKHTEYLDSIQFAKKQGLKEGREEGKKEGWEEGKKEGREEGKKEAEERAIKREQVLLLEKEKERAEKEKERAEKERFLQFSVKSSVKLGLTAKEISAQLEVPLKTVLKIMNENP